VNKFIKNYLYSRSAGKHWLQTGQQICGKEYWPDYERRLWWWDDRYEDETGPRYTTMLMLCPWWSIPFQTSVEPVRGIKALGGNYQINWMNVNYEEYRWEISASIKYPFTQTSLPYHLTAEAFYEPSDGPQEWSSEEDEHTPPPPASPEETQLLLNLKALDWRPSAMYPDSDIQRVFVVHPNLLCVLCYGNNEKTQAYFVSAKTMRVLHTLTGFFTKNIVIKSAAIWILESNAKLIRIAPREDRSIKNEILHDKSGVENVLWAAYKGNMDEMLSMPQTDKVLNVEQYDTDLPSIVDWVIASGSVSTLVALLDRKASFADSHALHLAVEAGNIDMVRILITYKAHCYSGLLLTAMASRNGTRDMVKLLLESGAKVEEADRAVKFIAPEGYRLHNSAEEWTPKEVYDCFVEAGMRIP